MANCNLGFRALFPMMRTTNLPESNRRIKKKFYLKKKKLFLNFRNLNFKRKIQWLEESTEKIEVDELILADGPISCGKEKKFFKNKKIHF